MLRKLKEILSDKYKKLMESHGQPDELLSYDASNKEEINVDRSQVVRMRFTFYGYVQGVGFRWRARMAAEQLELTGWVMNQDDGSVLMEAQGPEELIWRMIAMIKNNGYVEISDYSCDMLPLDEKERSFRVRGGY